MKKKKLIVLMVHWFWNMSQTSPSVVRLSLLDCQDSDLSDEITVWVTEKLNCKNLILCWKLGQKWNQIIGRKKDILLNITWHDNDIIPMMMVMIGLMTVREGAKRNDCKRGEKKMNEIEMSRQDEENFLHSSRGERISFTRGWFWLKQ